MWLQNPVFGQGLGAFVNQEWLLNNRYLMIHSSYIWLLAEMGIIGFSVWGLLGAWIVSSANKLPQKFRLATLFICFIIFVSAAVHEVIYQRIFWWMLGLMFCSKPDALAFPERLQGFLVNLPIFKNKECNQQSAC